MCMFTKQTCHRILNNRVTNVYLFKHGLHYFLRVRHLSRPKKYRLAEIDSNETEIDGSNCISHVVSCDPHCMTERLGIKLR